MSQETTKKVNVRPSHRKAVQALLDTLSGPFRRSNLSNVLYPMISPRTYPAADRLADALLRELAKEGKIIRHGHQHWIRATVTRTLLSGRAVAELPDQTVELTLTTHCPGKWVAMDLETGHVWEGTAQGWTKASPTVQEEALMSLKERRTC